jgi:hypothetical protein
LGEKIELLIRAFPDLVAAFQRKAPFRRVGQFEYHRDTIAARREAGSGVAALQSPEFLKLLYCTLKAWGIGTRGSHLVPFPAFESSLRAHEGQIADLEKLAIDDARLDVGTVAERLWRVLDGLRITDNKARLVPCTKALHHVLPDLVVPIDRKYTQWFFGWHSPEFQSRQRACFRQAFEAFARVARAVNPSQFVGSGWNTSKTKVIDNAIVGLFVTLAELAASRT